MESVSDKVAIGFNFETSNASFLNQSHSKVNDHHSNSRLVSTFNSKLLWLKTSLPHKPYDHLHLVLDTGLCLS